jgi:hypothetical protein
MIAIIRVRREPEENPDEESPEHEWAEYNLPLAMLMGLAADDEDRLAFLGFSTEVDAELPEGSS